MVLYKSSALHPSQAMRAENHLKQVETLKLHPMERKQVSLFLKHLRGNAITMSAAGYFDFDRRMLMGVSSNESSIVL